MEYEKIRLKNEKSHRFSFTITFNTITCKMDQLYVYATYNFSLVEQFQQTEFIHQAEVDQPEFRDDIAENLATTLRWSNEPALYLGVVHDTYNMEYDDVRAEHLILSWEPLEPIPICTRLMLVMDTLKYESTYFTPHLSGVWEPFVQLVMNYYNEMLDKTLESIHHSASVAILGETETQSKGELMLPILEEMIQQYPYTSKFVQAKQEAMQDMEQFYAPGGKGAMDAIARCEYTVKA